MSRRGELAVVLHAHMPYVEGYGTWPFGEEWLWEAIVQSYLPLSRLFGADAPLTLSLTPVLLDQLLAEGVAARFCRFVEEVRAKTFAADIEELAGKGKGAEAAELERCWQSQYRPAAQLLRGGFGPLLDPLLKAASLTSAATHAVLPLLASKPLLRAQVRIGAEGFRLRTGRRWDGGFWLPECGHAGWLEPTLAEEGVRYFCVEWTKALGRGSAANLRPVRTAAGPVAVPIDREGIDLVWGRDGYPSAPPYRCSHLRTPRGHSPWAIDRSPYDPRRARALARSQAARYAAYLADRLREGGLLTVAFDAELFGLWWHEGVWFLEALLEALAESPVALVRLGEAQALAEAAPAAPPQQPTTWGAGGDLSTWSTANRKVRELAAEVRRLELELAAVGAAAPPHALRHLLALQASDWTYMVAFDSASQYGLRRFAGHREGVERALDEEPVSPPRNLAPFAKVGVLGEP